MWRPLELACARTVALAAAAAVLGAAGCAEESLSVRIDPDAVGSDQGTLVSTSDIRSVAAQMVESLNASRIVGELRRVQKPLRILIGDIKQRTSIAIFDKRVFVNELLGGLVGADLGGSYTFLRRQSPAASPDGAGVLQTGAEFVLAGEIRELLHREPAPGGGEMERRSVQYSLNLTRVNDAAVLWSDSRTIVKQQITGAVYR